MRPQTLFSPAFESGRRMGRMGRLVERQIRIKPSGEMPGARGTPLGRIALNFSPFFARHLQADRHREARS